MNGVPATSNIDPSESGRDGVLRGRMPPATNVPISVNPTLTRDGSRSHSSAASRSPVIGGPPLERKASLSYSHMRQMSKSQMQGRNGNITVSPGSAGASPISPDQSGLIPEDSLKNGAYGHAVRRGASQRLPSKSSNNSHSSSGQQASMSNYIEGVSGTSHKRVERSQSSRRRTEHSHRRSNSRSKHEQRGVGEWALHHLFDRYVAIADQKIKQCLLDQTYSQDAVERICGPGVDTDFDKLLSSMAHITRRDPKPLVDVVMLWRQKKARGEAEDGYDTINSIPLSRDQSKRSGESSQPQSPESRQNSSLEETPYHTEQRGAVAIYLACRVLLEVFRLNDSAGLPANLNEHLESIIFQRLSLTDPNTLDAYPFRKATLVIYSQVLGVMSTRSFAGVAKSFLADLLGRHRELFQSGKTVVSKELEYRYECMIRSMSHLHIRTRPETIWAESCSFLTRLADLFLSAHGPAIKTAFCYIFVDLLLPVASNWNSNIATQKFRDFLTIIHPRISNMASKPKYWVDAIHPSTILLCISSNDQFQSANAQFINNIQPKLKDRSTRSIAIQCITRVVWTYLERLKEGTSPIRRLDETIKAILPSSKKTSMGLENMSWQPVVELLRIIGYHQQEYCFSKIIFPLLNSELFASGKDIKVEHLDPERMVIGIKSFLVIMNDIELGERGKPPFPRFASGGYATDPSIISSNEPSFFGNVVSNVLSDAQIAQNSKPVAVGRLSPSAREYHARFCEILGKITIICDNAFGGQAALDEKLSVGSGGFTPKTPLSETFPFGRRGEDHQGAIEHRMGFYELLHVAVQALPRCLSAQVPLKPLINLLCTCTAHVQSNIAASSIHTLRAIARQSHAQPVTIGFARFIFNFDARYSTMSEEGLLGPEHIESTLSLYVELLSIWIEEVKQKTKEAASGISGDSAFDKRGLQLDLTSVTNHVDEVESHGLFFLCSQSRRVRTFAVKVLKLVTEFDTALGTQNLRTIHILEGDFQKVMNINDETLTVAERSRLQKGKSKALSQSTLIELSASDNSYDASLWLKAFPNIIRLSSERCPMAMMLGREIVCARLLQMHETITFIDSDSKGLPPIPSYENYQAKAPHRLHSTSPQVVIEQWKLYLIMACTTMTNTGAQTQSQLDKTQHARKISKPAPQGQDKISSARALFAYVIPLLSAGNSSIRDAIVIALSSINTNLYRTLLESLQYAVTTCKEEAKQRIGSHQRSGSNARRLPSTDHLRTEVTQVYRLTARFLEEPNILQDEWILNNISTYAKDLMLFLGDADVQNDWTCQKLRRQYCGLIEELFNGLTRMNDPLRYLPFENRRSAFALMEDWCGCSPNITKMGQREDSLRSFILDQQSDSRERNNIAAAFESEKRDLSTAALSAMAALCAGPIHILTSRGETLSFDSRRMLTWIDQIFSSPLEKLHAIGRRALHNLISHNRDLPYLVQLVIEQCYSTDRPLALESYFDVVSRVLSEYEDIQIPFWRILAALLFLLGNDKSEVRIRSAKLIQRLEQRRDQDSKIHDFDISVSDRTKAVYKSASFEISRRLSKEHKELAFFIFSQFSLHFRNIHPDNQRQMVYAILPWIQVIELQVDTNQHPTAPSYMLLANLLEITTQTSGVLHNEVQALWKALATGHAGNVQLVLNFVISLCLDRRDQAFVSIAKQIIVYMAGAEAGPKVVEFLILQINPRNMISAPRDPVGAPTDHLGLPYVADLQDALPTVNKQDLFALSQLALVFLVDLIVAPMTVKAETVPLLLHTVFVLWDNQIALVQEQAREMLVHLIHELVITKIPKDQQETYAAKKNVIETFVEQVRLHDSTVIWHYREKAAKYEEWNGRTDPADEKRIPASMLSVTNQVVDIFSLIYPEIQDGLARTALSWGTTCPVRHTACRSLQIFRCILVPLDRAMLGDMLARISNIVVHEAEDVQTFSMEMLTTVKCIIESLEPSELLQYPQIFWTTCACLDTIYEREFVASVSMLHKLLSKLNFNAAPVVKLLRAAKPAKWHGNFEGVAPLVYKGLKSEMSLDVSLMVLDHLVLLPDIDLIGNHTRLLFITLANLPRLLASFDDKSHLRGCLRTVDVILAAAESQRQEQLVSILDAYRHGYYTSADGLLSQVLGALRVAYFPTWELKALIFIIGLVSNRLQWYKTQTLRILKFLITDVDTQRSEITSCGPDLISPLLRLLRTEFSQQVLEILDHIAFMAETPLTTKHLRMSVLVLNPRSKQLRKEYEKTQSLYGIPEESGWSIPMPAVHTNSTKQNMHLIYQDCLNSSQIPAESVPTPPVEFHPDEELDASYFPSDRQETISTQDTLVSSTTEGGMGDALSKLNELDDFFDETLDLSHGLSDQFSPVSSAPYMSDPETGAEIYDQETAPMLQRSIGRTASVTSLQQHASERPQNGIMTQANFTPPTPSSAFVAPPRPQLHSRSVTSPANNFSGKVPNLIGELLSDDEIDDGVFSEDERATGHVIANDSRLLGSTSLRRGNSAIRKMQAPGQEGKEYMQRGLLRNQSRPHGHSPGSPSVPKVPEAYLQRQNSKKQF